MVDCLAENSVVYNKRWRPTKTWQRQKASWDTRLGTQASRLMFEAWRRI